MLWNLRLGVFIGKYVLKTQQLLEGNMTACLTVKKISIDNKNMMSTASDSCPLTKQNVAAPDN